MKPVCEPLALHIPGCHLKDHLFLLAYWSLDLKTIENQKDLHCRVSRSLVTIHEWVILYQRVAKRGGLIDDSRL